MQYLSCQQLGFCQTVCYCHCQKKILILCDFLELLVTMCTGKIYSMMLLYLKLPAGGYFCQWFSLSVMIQAARWGGSFWTQLRGGAQAEISSEGDKDWKYVSEVGFHCRPPWRCLLYQSTDLLLLTGRNGSQKGKCLKLYATSALSE